MMKPHRWLSWKLIRDFELDREDVECEFLTFQHGDALWSYKFPDGRYYEEFVQCFNSALSVSFLALKDSAGVVVPESLWSKEAIRMAEQAFLGA